jgi:hypothetical protein
MTPGGAATALPGADLVNCVEGCARNVWAAWRGLSRKQFRWTLAVGTAGGLFFLVSHGSFEVRRLLEHRVAPASAALEITVILGATIAVTCLFLLALRVAEHGDRGQARSWMRYVVATVTASAVSAAIVHYLSPYIPVDGLVGWYGVENQLSVDSFVFTNWLLFGGLGVFVYVRLSRVRRTQAAFEQAELERVTASRQVLKSQLAAMQARVEPKFLFNTLGHVEALYERDAASGDRMLDSLIMYLRAALPQLRAEDSTLARESDLAEAYLRIVQVRMGSRLEFDVAIPRELDAVPFPPMLLLPLVENAIQHGLEPLSLGGRIEVSAARHAGCLRLSVSDNGLGDAAEIREGDGLTMLRERLDKLFGGRATLSLNTNLPRGVTATIEVQAHARTSDHR